MPDSPARMNAFNFFHSAPVISKNQLDESAEQATEFDPILDESENKKISSFIPQINAKTINQFTPELFNAFNQFHDLGTGSSMKQMRS